MSRERGRIFYPYGEPWQLTLSRAREGECFTLTVNPGGESLLVRQYTAEPSCYCRRMCRVRRSDASMDKLSEMLFNCGQSKGAK